jgi:hypothetical protein
LKIKKLVKKLGRTGKTEWKTKEGTTLKDLEGNKIV